MSLSRKKVVDLIHYESSLVSRGPPRSQRDYQRVGCLHRDSLFSILSILAVSLSSCIIWHIQTCFKPIWKEEDSE